MLDQRGQLLRAAVGFCPHTTAHSGRCGTWLDSWPGIGHVAVGMHRQGYDLQLTQYDERGWHATQRAAWEALKKNEEDDR
jgi:hypothetical protein